MEAQTETHLPREAARKLVHISFGIFAFSLVWLTTLQAALVAATALFFNRFLLPRFGGKAIARRDHGWDTGIVLYPLAVLVVILCFPSRPWIAAAVWCILAFGDGTATIAGKTVPLGRLPWNRTKSWGGLISFVLFGGLSAWAALEFVGSDAGLGSFRSLLLAAAAALICGIVETLPIGVDDNISVPLAGSLFLGIVSVADRWPVPDLDPVTLAWLAVNVALGVAGYLARSVTKSGAVGGIVLGSILIAFGGWDLYLILLLFFVIASLLTKLGYDRKAAVGLAQEEGGRRGFSHAFANVGVAAILALLFSSGSFSKLHLWISAAGALVTALADTAASEIGQLYGRRTFMPLSLRRVERGTEGAISFEGTVGGFAAAATLGIVAGFLSRSLGGDWLIVATILTIAGVVGSWIESVLGSFNRKSGGVVANGALNFFNTMTGAAIAYGVSRWLI